MSITKKDRFDVFKRDGFVCQYCGGTPPKVVLEIDHINPKSNGGENNKDNYITSCFDCNRGKGKTELSVLPQTLIRKTEIIEERKEQLRKYNKLIESLNAQKEKMIDKI
jgi:5-methylcytosine-specific restriction endonuclease McrA